MYENVCVCMLGWPDPVISVLSCCLDFFVLALLYSDACFSRLLLSYRHRSRLL